MRRYQWIPDLPDKRDLLFTSKPRVSLPSRMDLRKLCPPVENQGNLGSCTGNALVGAMEMLITKQDKKHIDLSRLFVYYNERELMGTIHEDSGAYIRDGIKSLAAKGVCTEELWPYKIKKYKIAPNKKCYVDAATRKVASYARLNTVHDMKSCLASFYPFTFGFSVYESFESSYMQQTGKGQLPSPNEKLLGGHAVLCVGYDDRYQRFIIRNSYGTEWGSKGYFTLPYEYLADRNLSDDFWVIYK